ncbi:MAG: hypothetical protein HQL26_06325 [Candidatus Omnitrophica bacterium]|nr:hypothetical protein [Candidatus Omnitrophota bacterium]
MKRMLSIFLGLISFFTLAVTTAFAVQDGMGRDIFLGNVGIGITAPTQSLEVTGVGKFNGVMIAQDLTMGTNTAGYMLVGDGNGFAPVAMSGDVTIDKLGVTKINVSGASTTVAITNDTSTNATMNLVWSAGTNGNQALKVSSTGFMYNPSLGNIGIGTSALTTSRLHVRGAGTTTGEAFAVQDSTLSDNFVVLDNGNVGIGNTTNIFSKLTVNAPYNSTNNVPDALLASASTGIGDVATNYRYVGEFQARAGNTSRLQIAAYRRLAGSNWTGLGWRLQYAVDTSFSDGSKAYIEIGGDDPNNASGGFISLGTEGLDRLVATSAGNIGIGTTAPSQKLEVAGVGKFIGAILSQDLTMSTNTAGYVLAADGNGFAPMQMTGDVTIDKTGHTYVGSVANVAITNDVSTNATMNLVWSAGVSGNQALKVSSTGLMYNPSLGNIGIGTSDLTGARLRVRSVGGTTGQAFSVQDTTLNDRFTVLDNGNVGIGTSAPGVKLNVSGGSAVVNEKSLTTTATINIDWSLGNQQYVGLNQAGHTITFTNALAGEAVRLIMCQSNANSTVTTWDASIVWSGGSAPTLSTTAGKCDVCSFIATNAKGSLKVLGTATTNF